MLESAFDDSINNYDLLYGSDSTNQRTFSDLKYGTKVVDDSLAEDIANQKYFINIKEYGAVGDGVTDDTEAFSNWLHYGITNGITLVLKDNYVISSTVLDTIPFGATLKIEGIGKPKIILKNGAYLLLRGQTVATPSLTNTATRGSHTIYIDDTTGIKKGDIIYLVSNDVAETAWGYVEEDIHEIIDIIDDTTIILSTPVNFDYDYTNTNIEVYRNGSVVINGVDFEIGYGSNIQFANMRNSSFSNSTITDSAGIRLQSNDGIYFTRTYQTYIDNIHLDGLRYGIGISNGARQTFLSNISAYKNYHPIVPSTFADGVYVDGLTASYCAGGIDAHPSFNINYKNVRSSNEIEFSVFRSLGGSLENVYIHSTSSTSQFLMGLTTMADTNICFESDYILRNVKFNTPNANTLYDNAITLSFYRTLIMDNVDVYYIEIGAAPDTQKTSIITNSNISNLKFSFLYLLYDNCKYLFE
jgi:hypothetical protein